MSRALHCIPASELGVALDARLASTKNEDTPRRLPKSHPIGGGLVELDDLRDAFTKEAPRCTSYHHTWDSN